MSIYICIYKFGPGLDSGSQPLSASKEIKPEHALSINKKTHAQSPIQELPYKKNKKTAFFLRGKIRMPLCHLLILLQPYFCSLFN